MGTLEGGGFCALVLLLLILVVAFLYPPAPALNYIFQFPYFRSQILLLKY